MKLGKFEIDKDTLIILGWFIFCIVAVIVKK